MTLSYSPLTPACWVDFVSLFGDRGACGGCWCMLWRLDRRRFESQKGEGNRRAMKAIVDSGEIPGILAYRGGRAVGWCAVSPRKTYSALSRSRILRPVDDREVWSIACLFIEKSHRNKGVSVDLLSAGAAFAASRGAECLEGYPVEPTPGNPVPPAFAWTGISRAFLRAGFREVARRSPTRPIMRLEVADVTLSRQGG